MNVLSFTRQHPEIQRLIARRFVLIGAKAAHQPLMASPERQT